MKSLLWIDLFGNVITGRIAPEIFNTRALESLYLAGNRISGSIPSQIMNAQNLVDLWLDDNYLTGSLPTEIGSLAKLSKSSSMNLLRYILRKR